MIITKNFHYLKISNWNQQLKVICLSCWKIFKDKKAAEIDQISGKFLTDGVWVLTKPISELWNLSMTLGGFLDACEIAKVKPLFKKGSKTDPSNCRPISLLLLLSKVFEELFLIKQKNS